MNYKAKNETPITSGASNETQISKKKGCIGCLFAGILLLILQQTCVYFACSTSTAPIVNDTTRQTTLEAAGATGQTTAERLEKERQDKIRRWKKATSGEFIGGLKVINVVVDYTEMDHYIEVKKGIPAWNISQYVPHLDAVLKSLQKNNCLDGKNINFIVVAEYSYTDNYGNEVEHTDKILEIAYSGNELNKVNWKKINGHDLFDLADYVEPLHPLGVKVLKKYVSSEGLRRITPKFCTKILELGLTPEN